MHDMIHETVKVLAVKAADVIEKVQDAAVHQYYPRMRPKTTAVRTDVLEKKKSLGCTFHRAKGSPPACQWIPQVSMSMFSTVRMQLPRAPPARNNGGGAGSTGFNLKPSSVLMYSNVGR